MTKQRKLEKKALINGLTFRMPQHTSSEVTVGYNTVRFKYDCFFLQHALFCYVYNRSLYIISV